MKAKKIVLKRGDNYLLKGTPRIGELGGSLGMSRKREDARVFSDEKSAKDIVDKIYQFIGWKFEIIELNEF
ncbi:MAG: hypothetical protein LBN98_03650 [Prevotellaceae bacterium]|jgi:hypothetical protein|nr:hypothetical protein [Prevotellaceae bacterium]